MQPSKLALNLDLINKIMLKTFNFKLSHYSFIIHLSIKVKFVYCNHAKLALSLELINEIILKTFDFKPSYYSSISLFFYYSFIHQSQIYIVYLYKLTLSLNSIKKIILKNKNHRFQIILSFFHYFFIIYLLIKVKFI